MELPTSNRVGAALPVGDGSGLVLVLFWIGEDAIERVDVGTQSVDADDVMVLPSEGAPQDLDVTAIAVLVRRRAPRQARVHFEDGETLAIPIPAASLVEFG